MVKWDDNRISSHIPEGLAFLDRGSIEIGSLVRIKPTVKNPQFGWGGLNPGCVGVVRSINTATDIVGVCFARHPGWKGKLSEMQRVEQTTQAQTLEVRAQASYERRGGILADKIGYGKTATTIALIASTLETPPPDIPDIDRGTFFPAKGTLNIVPSNLLDQWLGEFAKFLWPGHQYRNHMK